MLLMFDFENDVHAFNSSCPNTLLVVTLFKDLGVKYHVCVCVYNHHGKTQGQGQVRLC